jgi:hypothetical protein
VPVAELTWQLLGKLVKVATDPRLFFDLPLMKLLVRALSVELRHIVRDLPHGSGYRGH